MKKNPTLEFFLQSIKHFRETGTLFPCTKHIGKQMAKNLDASGSGTIVELGAGAGAITREILTQMNGSHKLLAIEINQKLCDVLRDIKDRRLEVINTSAEKFPDYLERKSPYIVSVLPLALFDQLTTKNILTTVRDNLTEGGTFVQLQYWPGRNYKAIKAVFPETKRSLAVRNIPPSVIYTCRN